MPSTTLNLFATAIEIDGVTIVTARKTPRGWYWFTNVGRCSRKVDFATQETALLAAAKTLGLAITEKIGGDGARTIEPITKKNDASRKSASP